MPDLHGVSTTQGSGKNKAQVAGARLLPEKARAVLHSAQTRPGTGDDSGDDS